MSVSRQSKRSSDESIGNGEESRAPQGEDAPRADSKASSKKSSDKQLTPTELAELAEYRSLFDYFDIDGSGSISCGELGSVMRQLGQDPTEEEVQMLMSEADEDDSGEIDFDEFVDVMKSATSNIFTKRELVDAFKALDLDGGGTIQAGELLKMSGEEMNARQLGLLLREADEDGDGEISLSEYLAVMGEEMTPPNSPGQLQLYP